MRRSGDLRSRLVLAVCSAAVALGLLEGVFRLLEPAAPELPSPVAPSPGTTRIAVLGGSAAGGLPVPSLGFAEQLRFHLARLAPERRFDLRNAAVAGRDSAWALRSLPRVLSGEPDLLIVLVGHNEFLDRSGEGSRWRTALAALGSRLAVVRVIARWRSAPPAPMPARLVPYAHDTAWFEGRIARFRANLEAMAELARASGVPLFALTAPSNWADWAPVHRDIAWSLGIPDYDATIDALEQAIAAGRADDAVARSQALRERWGDDAMWLYLQGRAERERGRPQAARPLLRRAVQRDPYPWRALDSMNAAVRTLDERVGVTVVDVEAGFAEHAADGLVGFALIGDNVHPTPLGNALVAREILRALGRERVLLSGPPRLEPPEAMLERFLEAAGPDARRRLQNAVRVENGIYCMKTPFYAYSAARWHLEGALALVPDHWRTWANLGTLSLLEGRRQQGLAELRRAVHFKGGALDPADTRRVPYLAVALERAGVDPAALAETEEEQQHAGTAGRLPDR